MCQPSSFVKSNPIWLAAILFVLFSSSGLASTRIDLNGEWQFKTDPAKTGEDQGWKNQIPAGTQTVRIPHTWNIGKYEDFEGTGWYFKTFEIPDELRAKRVELHFGATF
jgi:beta-galactosidase/beta-glucuronidase